MFFTFLFSTFLDEKILENFIFLFCTRRQSRWVKSMIKLLSLFDEITLDEMGKGSRSCGRENCRPAMEETKKGKSLRLIVKTMIAN
jgi:hypothetical protein